MNALTRLRSPVMGKPDASEDDTIIRQAVNTALTPFRVATSRSALKAYLGTLLFLITSGTLLSISTTAYLFFYYKYIPQINLEKTVYLQYAAGPNPHATVALETNALVSQQSYDIDLILHMPRTPANIAAGNFMLDLSLLTDSPSANPSPSSTYLLPNTTTFTGKRTLDRSRRPAILPYTSHITSLSHTLLHLPIHLLSWKDLDSSTLTIPMFELVSFPRGRANIPTHAYIELQSQAGGTPERCPPQPLATSGGIHLLSPAPSPPTGASIQVYSAKLSFRARFQGLRYVIYNYRVVSFLAFSTLFYTFSFASMATAWALVTMFLAPSKEGYIPSIDASKPEADSAGYKTIKAAADKGDAVKNEPGLESEKKSLYGIKSEHDDEDNDGTLDSSDAEHAARTGAVITDHHHDAEDEDDEEEEDAAAESKIDLSRSGSGVGIKKEEEDDDERTAKVGDSGIGTSMESEAAVSASGLLRRRSGRGSNSGSRAASRNGTRG